ncbi:MAG: hypothetical protein ABI600_01440 [Luteolibacter sp.]
MTRHAILIVVLIILTGCRDDETAASRKKSAEIERFDQELTGRVETERLELSERKIRLHTFRVVGFIVLTGGAVSGLIWLRQQRVSNPVGNRASNYQTPPTQANDHYPVPPGRVLDLRTSLPLTQARRTSHETPRRS